MSPESVTPFIRRDCRLDIAQVCERGWNGAVPRSCGAELRGGRAELAQRAGSAGAYIPSELPTLRCFAKDPSMPTFTVIATTLSQGSDDAEIDARSGDFRSPDEAIGYARRIAEENFELAGELALDYDYSQVAIYEGDPEPSELDIDAPDLLGVWLFFEDGVAWSSAQTLRDQQEANATSQ